MSSRWTGVTGFKADAAEQLPDAVAGMEPFHVVRLAGEALDRCRRRVQQTLHGHRGMKNDPLHKARRTPHTWRVLLTDKQRDRPATLFAADEHVEVGDTGGIYQRMIAAYREPDRTCGRPLTTGQSTSSTSLPRTVPASPTRCAWATSVKGKVWPTRTENRPFSAIWATWASA
ncbi:hypothetical protein SRB17_49110 [Streptomyces sp. RB17]|nr:hypothetical protein [Streptomyces sp. RB17]